MRPEKFTYLMDLAFKDWFLTKSNKKFIALKREMEKLWPKWAIRDDDFRVGTETYGYISNFEGIADDEHIRLNMSYISDRWNCAFRLKWLLDGIKSGKI